MDVINALICAYKGPIKRGNCKGNLPLHVAVEATCFLCSCYTVSIVRTLLAACPKPMYIRNAEKLTPLLLAIHNHKCLQVIQAFTDADPNIVRMVSRYPDIEDVDSDTESVGSVESDRDAVFADESPDSDDEIEIALPDSEANKTPKCYGSDELSDSEDNLLLPVHVAAYNRNFEIVNLFIELYPESIAIQDRTFKRTPLHWACSRHNTAREPIQAIVFLLKDGPWPLHCKIVIMKCQSIWNLSNMKNSPFTKMHLSWLL